MTPADISWRRRAPQTCQWSIIGLTQSDWQPCTLTCTLHVYAVEVKWKGQKDFLRDMEDTSTTTLHHWVVLLQMSRRRGHLKQFNIFLRATGTRENPEEHNFKGWWNERTEEGHLTEYGLIGARAPPSLHFSVIWMSLKGQFTPFEVGGATKCYLINFYTSINFTFHRCHAEMLHFCWQFSRLYRRCIFNLNVHKIEFV